MKLVFLTISTDLLCSGVSQMPRSPDPAIFVLTDRQTELIALPLVHARRVIIKSLMAP